VYFQKKKYAIILLLHHSKHLRSHERQRSDCCNLSLRLTTKARACKSAGQEGSLGITSHAPGRIGVPILGVGVSMNSQFFRKQLQGSKAIGLKRSLYHWKALGM